MSTKDVFFEHCGCMIFSVHRQKFWKKVGQSVFAHDISLTKSMCFVFCEIYISWHTHCNIIKGHEQLSMTNPNLREKQTMEVWQKHHQMKFCIALFFLIYTPFLNFPLPRPCSGHGNVNRWLGSLPNCRRSNPMGGWGGFLFFLAIKV